MTKKLYVCFTMDVERIKAQSWVGGPPTWEFAEIAARSYCDALRESGYRATLFIVPDTADKQAGVLRRLQKDGHECGMHLHPQAWRDNYKQPDAHDYLGGYTGEEQFEMLGAARDQWAAAMGCAPASFRPGNFSASDATFGVLDALGFTCGSVSQPGRFAPKYKAVWTGASRGVHHAHKGFRLEEGGLNLVEVPQTVDANRTDHWTGVGDARLEDWDAPDILEAVEDSLKWQMANSAVVHHVCLFTHNTINYSPRDVEVPFGHVDVMGGKTRLPVLQGVIDALPALAAGHGMSVEGCTVSDVRDHYLTARKGKQS